MSPISRLAFAARRGFGRITPDPFVLAIFLTVAVLLTAWLFGEVSVGSSAIDASAPAGTRTPRIDEVLTQWSGGGGLWKLLAFGMQASLMLVLGTALAEAPSVRAVIEGLAARARGPRRLVAWVAFVSIALGLLNWSLSLIGGALLAKAAGRHAKARGWGLDYPLLAAAGYSGLMVWHGGLSGTAPLKVTGNKDLVEVLGPELAERVGTMELSQTLFSELNLVVSGGLLVLGPLLFMAMTPKDGSDPSPRPMPLEVAEASERPRLGPGPGPGVETERGLEHKAWVLWLLGGVALMALTVHFASKGFGRVDLNTVNLSLWVLAMLLHGRPAAFVAACERGIRGATGIFLQFPLYAGIMGVMAGSGLSAKLAGWAADAGATLLAPITFLSAALLNLFVPSGGGQWAVQGPIIMRAALDAGVEPAHILMAMAYGDQLTNMLQPFWALPLLAITGCKAREIVGYCALYMVTGALWILGALFVLVG